MFQPSFVRILWKEYRAQRSLGVICLLLGILLECIAAVVFADAHDQGPLFHLPAVLAGMYAVGCGAILFAGEREDRTSDWLVSLAPAPRDLLAGKIGFAVISTMIIQLLLTLAAIAMTVGRERSIPTMEIPLFVPTAIVVLVWSILGSLTTRKVLISVVLTIFWFAVTILLPVEILRRYFEWLGIPAFSPIPIGALMAIAVVALELWIGGRWCQGAYLDGSCLENLDGHIRKFRSRLRVWPSALKILRASDVEHEQSWRRAWRRLLWQERRRESILTTSLMLGFASAVLVAIVIYAPNAPGTFWANLSVLTIIPTVIGMNAFESDPERLQTRFLSNRGIAPASVWLAKQVVWMSRAFWVAALLVTVTLCAESMVAGIRQRPIIDPDSRLFADVFTHPEQAVWSIVFAFACGQLASFLISRFVLAAVVALFLGIAVSNWQACVFRWDVPRWWSLGFPLIAMFLITLWQSKSRMLEQLSLTRYCKLLAVLVAVPVLTIALFAAYRIAVVATLDWQGEAALANQIRILPGLSKGERFVTSRIDVLSRSQLAHDPATADEIVQLMKRDLNRLDIKPRTQRAADVVMLAKAVLTRAGEFEQDERLDDALECYLAALKLARLSGNGAEFHEMWLTANAMQFMTLEKLVRWANHPSQTETKIRDAIVDIREELEQYPHASEAVAVSYLSDHRIVNSSSIDELNHYVVSGRHLVDRSIHDIFGIVWLPWERWRLDILMTREAEYLFSEITLLEQKLNSYPTPVVRFTASKPLQKQRVAFDLPDDSQGSPGLQDRRNVPLFWRWLLPQSMDQRLMAPATQSLKSMQEYVLQRETEIRAGLVRMELVAYRLSEGDLPEKLIQLMQTLEGRYLIDPWSNRLFDFYPIFLLSVGKTNDAVVPTSPVEIQHLEFLRGQLPGALQQLTSKSSRYFDSVTPPFITSTNERVEVFRTIYPMFPNSRFIAPGNEVEEKGVIDVEPIPR